MLDHRFEVWMDTHGGISAGDINAAMAEGVEGATVVVPLLSEDYLNSRNCQKELSYADTLRLPIVPVMVQEGFNPSGWLAAIVAGKLWFPIYSEADASGARGSSLADALTTTLGPGHPAVAPAVSGLSALLARLGLSQFEEPLQSDLGVASVQDLQYVDATMLGSIDGLKPVQRAKLLRAASEADATSVAGGAPSAAAAAPPPNPSSSIAEAQRKQDFAALVQVMSSDVNSAVVQEQGCAALRCLTANNDENRRTAGAAGAVEAVVAALRVHGSSAAVQTWGCWAMGYLTANNDENKRTAGAAGAVEAVVAALRVHGSSAAVQEQGCGAMRNLTANDENKRTAGAAGAVEAVVAALRVHGSSAAVQ
eukprot:CAMPEP_0170162002 /NCGR_PEP_ID=MMETSP0033_2-20121228/76878_1 /TAXON_ID=195969 /ORGANISM="Dolichomastix tenuilepis, Strain CCMP3274" /LENGTH=365 /DNA_ID=CAMNT_0010399627 /DNA_START=15 /DNA_END=1109 /DNA_ORIENTATION=-